MASIANTHRWRFFRAGGSDQVALETSADLAQLENLDQKLWVALACPVVGLEFDERTLALMDGDGDGRIRAPEVIAATQWACAMLKDPASLMKGGDLALASINDSTEQGKRLLASAREILAGLGKRDATAITIADTMETATVFSHTRFNGDGIIPPDEVDDATAKGVAEDLIRVVGGEADRAGRVGISQKTLDHFFAECAAFGAWWDMATGDKARLPLGDATPAAHAAFVAVRAKIDDYFARARLAAFDARALAAVNRQESEYLAIAAQDLTVTAQEVAGFPVARVEAGRPLPLLDGINPAWADAIVTFRTAALTPLLGERDSLSEADWGALKSKFGAFEVWMAGKAGAAVESLGAARIKEILTGHSKATLSALVAQDAAHEPEMTAIASVERLARYHRDLYRLLNNFVAFRDFYSRERPALFQAGTLLLDGRSCDLCIRVVDAGRHASLAALAKTYLAYCDCTRPGGESMTIAAAFTGGDSDNLMVGRNGIFYDRKGRDWDATITKVIENPISISQAFWAPYKKVVRMIEEQVAKRAAAGEAAADSKLSSAAAGAANADKKVAEPKKIDVGTVAALGVAFGAIGTALAAILGYASGMLGLPFWQLVLALGALLVLISTPSMLIAWLKLRQRTLGPILDANGWAVNGRVKMNVPFGGALTKVAHLPQGAGSSFAVKYPEPPTVLPKLVMTGVTIAFLFSLLNHYGLVHRLSGGRVGRSSAQLQVERAARADSLATRDSSAAPRD